MIKSCMTKERRSEDDVIRDLAKVSGLVVGRDGKGGSGTCVQLSDGTVALLTAKHVVIECIRNTGEIAIAAPFSGVGFQQPRSIRMDSSQQGDAAILVFNGLVTEIPTIPFASWTINHTEIAIGLRVFACGFPGALRKLLATQLTPTFAYLKDKISSIQGNAVVCGINETMKDTPSQFRGMSGGGLFSAEGDFLGVVIEESRCLTPSRGELLSLLPGAFEELYKPFSIPPDAPKGGYYTEKRSVALDLFKPDNSGIQATVGVLAELYWSKTDPNHKYGRIGRLITLEFIIPGIDTHYPINIESLFSWADDTEVDRMDAIQEEFKFLLLRMGWLINGNLENGQSILQVHPMI